MIAKIRKMIKSIFFAGAAPRQISYEIVPDCERTGNKDEIIISKTMADRHANLKSNRKHICADGEEFAELKHYFGPWFFSSIRKRSCRDCERSDISCLVQGCIIEATSSPDRMVRCQECNDGVIMDNGIYVYCSGKKEGLCDFKLRRNVLTELGHPWLSDGEIRTVLTDYEVVIDLYMSKANAITTCLCDLRKYDSRNPDFDCYKIMVKKQLSRQSFMHEERQFGTTPVCQPVSTTCLDSTCSKQREGDR